MLLSDVINLDSIISFLNANSGYIRYIVSAFVIGLDILALLGALIYMAFGFIFGTRKSLRRFLTFIIPFTILILLVNPISSLISNIIFKLLMSEYGETLYGYIEEFTASYGYPINISFEEFPHAFELAEATTYMSIRLAIFTLGLLLILLLICPLTRFITWLTYRVQMSGKEKNKMPLVSRFGGMGIASIRYIFVLILVVTPIHGLISSTSLVLKDASILLKIEQDGEVKTNQAIETTSDILGEISEGLNYSITRQFFKQSERKIGVSLDVLYLGQFFEIKTEDTSSNVFEEYNVVRKIFPLTNKVINIIVKEEKEPIEIINNFEITDVETIDYILHHSSFIKLTLPISFEVLCVSVEQIEEFQSLGIDINKIKEIDINRDFDLLVQSGTIILKVVVSQDLEYETENELVDKIINNEILTQELKTFISSILETDIVSKIGMPIFVDYINQYFEEVENPELKELKTIFTQEKIEKTLKNDISAAFEIAQTLYNSDLQPLFVGLLSGKTIDEIEIDFTSDNIKETISTVVEKTLNFEIIRNSEELLIKALLSSVFEDDVNIDEILYDESGNKLINWQNEALLLVDVVFEIVKVLGIDFESLEYEQLEQKVLMNKEVRDKLINLISESDVARYLVLIKTPEMLKESDMIPEEFFEFFTSEKFEELNSVEKFSKELKLLLGVVEGVINIGILDYETFNLDEENKEEIKTIIKDLLNSHFILNEEEKLVKLLIEKTNFSIMLEENGIVLDYSNVTNWHLEIEKIIDIAVEFLAISTGDSFDLTGLFESNMEEEEIDKIAKLFESVASSELFKPIIYQLVDNVGYEINITEEDKVKIEANGWYNEIKSLLSIIGDAQELLENGDLESLSGSQVETLMLDASNGIITSKVVGNILTTALGPDGLNINTVDENGNSKYDFTDPEVLKKEAKNIANLIDLANGLSNIDLENEDTITLVTDALANIENNELAKDFVKEIIGEDVNLEEVSKDADLIKDVYEEYQKSEDKENFVLDPNSEIATKLEESGLAKTILEMMGIL